MVESPVRRPISRGTKRPYCQIKNYFPATKRTLREAPRFFGTTMGFPRKKNQVLPKHITSLPTQGWWGSVLGKCYPQKRGFRRMRGKPQKYLPELDFWRNKGS